MSAGQQKSFLYRVLRTFRRAGRKLVNPWLHHSSAFEHTISAQVMALRHELDIHQQALADLSQANQELLQALLKHQREMEARLSHAHPGDSSQIRDFILPYIHELRELQKRVYEQSSHSVLPFSPPRKAEAA